MFKVHSFLIAIILFLGACRLPRNRAGGQENTAQAPTPAATAMIAQQPADFMDRFSIDANKHPNARCNDGTVPVFYYRRGVGDGANKWVIWFKGGGSGYSAESFKDRGPTLTSSNPWMQPEYAQLGSSGNQGSPDGEAGGILSSVQEINPDFFTWSHVYLVYCSSDGWTGTRTSTEQTGGILFAGKFIVDAMFDALRDSAIVDSPNLADAEQIILSGSSAGGLGLRTHVDDLVDEFPLADVRAISDAGVFLTGFPEMDEEIRSVQQTQYETWGAHIDEDCSTANEDMPWMCMHGGFLVQNDFIQTPLFIHQDQSDVKLREAIIALEYDLDFTLLVIGEATRELLATQDGVFSPNAGRHIIINSNRFSKFKLNGMAFSDVFGNWYFDRPGATVVIESP